MNKKIYIAIITGILFFLGNTQSIKAGCLMSCEEDTSEAYMEDEEKLPNEEAQKDERTQHFGNLRDSVVVSGVEMNSSNHVTVGSNSGDINTTSSTIIMGVNKSHSNTNNTNTTSNR